MSQAEELLNALADGVETTYPTKASEDEVVVISNDKFITVPLELQNMVVQYEHNVETVTFKCPRYSDDVDMFTMIPFVNYMRPDGGLGSCECTNKKIDEADPSVMYFDWTITKDVTLSYGQLKFVVCIKTTDANGNLTNHWNSKLCSDLYIAEGLESDNSVVSQYPDVITSILVRLGSIENSGASLFEGTRAQYEAAYNAGKISVGTFVIITDEVGDDDLSTTSVLGDAVLGQMILG